MPHYIKLILSILLLANVKASSLLSTSSAFCKIGVKSIGCNKYSKERTGCFMTKPVPCAMIWSTAGNKNFKRRDILGPLLGGVASLVGVGEVYSRIGNGKNFDNPLPTPEKGWDSIEKITLIFPGAGGTDAYTDELLNKLSQQKSSKSDDHYYTLIDWSEYSKDTLQASFNGQKIGGKIASKIINKAKNLKSIHVIGISVGAFAADSCVDYLKMSKDPYVQLTLLDPFCVRGVVGLFYGANNFGVKADYAQQYMNTDDPVPSTNFALRNCAVTDVTNIRPPAIFGHDWPLVYYSRNKHVGFVPVTEQRARGDIITINVSDK